MINALELRIGNYFHPIIEGYINLPQPQVCRVGSINKFGKVEVIEPGDPVTHSYKQYAGVLITQEWFAKLGFIYNKSQSWYELKGLMPFVITKHPSTIFSSKYILTTFKKDWNLAEFMYVHELQNLILDLSKQSLSLQDIQSNQGPPNPSI
jgi:hypothetical protein